MIENKLKKIIADQLGMDPAAINLTDALVADLGADSLDLVELVVSIEQQFDIKIENDEYEDLTQVHEVVELIGSKL